MAQFTLADLHTEIDVQFPDNTTELITPEVVRTFLHECVDAAVGVATSLLLPAQRPGSGTLTAADLGGVVRVNSSTPATLTVASGLGLAAPAAGATGAARVCYPLQEGAGQLSVAAGAGVALLYPPGGGPKCAGQNGRLILIWLDVNTVLVEGGTP